MKILKFLFQVCIVTLLFSVNTACESNPIFIIQETSSDSVDGDDSEQECEIGLEIEWSECVDGTYTLFIHYEVVRSTNDFIDVWVNNEYIDLFAIDASGTGTIIVENVSPRENSDYDIVQVCVNDNPDCCYEEEYEPCEDEEEDGDDDDNDNDEECEIELEVEFSDCTDSTYTLFIHYEVENPNNDFIDVWVNNEYVDLFTIDSSGNGTITVENVSPRENSGYDIVRVCVNDNPDCCYEEEYEPCEDEDDDGDDDDEEDDDEEDDDDDEECEIELEVEFSECTDSTFTLFIHYEVENPTNEFIDVWVNNEYVDLFAIDASGTGTITVENVSPRENSDYDIVQVCVNDNENCCEEEEFMPPCE